MLRVFVGFWTNWKLWTSVTDNALLSPGRVNIAFSQVQTIFWPIVVAPVRTSRNLFFQFPLPLLPILKLSILAPTLSDSDITYAHGWSNFYLPYFKPIIILWPRMTLNKLDKNFVLRKTTRYRESKIMTKILITYFQGLFLILRCKARSILGWFRNLKSKNLKKKI